jgi:hypothetical protein
MTATAPHTEFRATNADSRPRRTADSFRLRCNASISRAEWQALLQADVGAALLSVAAMAGRRGEKRYMDLSLEPPSNRAAGDQPAMFCTQQGDVL